MNHLSTRRAGILRQMAACFWRDLLVARAYRSQFLFSVVNTLFGAASLYFLSQFVQSDKLARALPAGTTYLGFALIGIAVFDYMGAAINAFDSSLGEARLNRTLEALLVTEASLPVILLGSAIYPFVFTSVRTAVYLAWGVLLFHLQLGSANWPGAILILSFSILAFIGLGILSTSYQMLFKRGNPAKWIFLGLSGLLGGMMYPVRVLPPLLQDLARVIPLTYSLEGMRAALLDGASLARLGPQVAALAIFAAVLLPVSFAVFAWALRRTKVTGTLTHF
ncbi:MAG TPA: ABC transporter permease [Candidatus Acidoferrales bacterium]|nr:ABC transporter permease [Candidatus Acidoferrales bacterium]